MNDNVSVPHPEKFGNLRRPTNEISAKSLTGASYPMSKLEQGPVMGFFILKGLQPRPIQTEFSNIYHEQAIQVLAVVKW
jgi:hypothetical protein